MQAKLLLFAKVIKCNDQLLQLFVAWPVAAGTSVVGDPGYFRKNYGFPQGCFGGKMIMDGGVANVHYDRNIGIAEAVESIFADQLVCELNNLVPGRCH